MNVFEKKARYRLAPLDVRAGYALWTKTYPARPHNPLMRTEQQAMLSLVPQSLAGRTCLDLACGSGRYLRVLRQRQVRCAVGLDLSAEMLAAAPGISAALGEFGRLPFAANRFDWVVCGLAVGHTPDLPAFAAETARVLRPGGQLLLSDIHPAGIAAGWQRTFTANGRLHRLEHHPHHLSDFRRACDFAGLRIGQILEPALAGDVPPEAQNIPAVLVIRAEKQC